MKHVLSGKEVSFATEIATNERNFSIILLIRLGLRRLRTGKSASKMFNFKSPSFKKLGTEQEKFNDNELTTLMILYSDTRSHR